MLDAATPQHIGRYEIVGRLATGGMAEVLLARLRGPHGFERPVVIKRILPHLALDRDVVDMFLDEARIIANLRHPNLIHVHELGRDRNELFMAMEFLEGESLAGLCRRLAIRGEYLDFDLAAHIVAEACAGLHAAHEAKSGDGRPLEIIHRDVSPENIFVTYAGGVHVIDFGIATTADRISRTEVGTVRGKFGYLAPEQLQSKKLDRRADVFALGVVLFELASGRRAYKRASPAETVVAVMSEPIPQISRFRHDVPTRLEEICARALAKKRAERFASAAEMRRELVAFARKRSDRDLGELLGRLMHDLFADRMSEKLDMLQRVRQGTEVATLPAAEVDIGFELPTAAEQPASAGTLSHEIPLAPVREPRRRRRLIAGASLVAVTAVAAFAAATGAVKGGASLSPPPAPAVRAAEQESPAPTAAHEPEAPSAEVPPSAVVSVTPPAASAPAHVPKPRRAPRPSTPTASKAAAPSPKPAPTLW